ncbi:MAG: hypothetical protein HY791_06925 [Deltaproteobacteria bacterium]|nr:hypothetical protein [Deltaproteobacteria bacterium]
MSRQWAFFALFLLLASCSGCAWVRSIFSPGRPAAESLTQFTLPEPDLSGARRLDLWATYFRTHRARAVSDGVELLAADGGSLGVRLSPRDFCQAAMDGAVRVERAKGAVTFGFAGLGDAPQTDCSKRFPKQSAISRTRFARTRGEFGDGAGGRRLVPLRSLAVDPKVIPIGSVVYVPQARGLSLSVPGGRDLEDRRVEHDGFFFAATTGGAIDGHKIDVFIGPLSQNPFSFVQSTKRGTFEAYLVEDGALEQAFEALHGRTPAAIAAATGEDFGPRPAWSSHAWASPW